MYCDLLTIGTWEHPSPLRHAYVLNGWSLSKYKWSPCFSKEWQDLSKGFPWQPVMNSELLVHIKKDFSVVQNPFLKAFNFSHIKANVFIEINFHNYKFMFNLVTKQEKLLLNLKLLVHTRKKNTTVKKMKLLTSLYDTTITT